MSVTKMPLRDDKGELIGLVSTTRDITARKNAEEQLAKYAEQLREKNAKYALVARVFGLKPERLKKIPMVRRTCIRAPRAFSGLEGAAAFPRASPRL